MEEPRKGLVEQRTWSKKDQSMRSWSWNRSFSVTVAEIVRRGVEFGNCASGKIPVPKRRLCQGDTRCNYVWKMSLSWQQDCWCLCRREVYNRGVIENEVRMWSI